ncbi:MAG: ATP-binding protein [Verrucomicrobia bacterium]|nr:ATP-binding protein [Verrucomicrobiota bacterium]
MPPSVQLQVFNRSFSTKGSGRGLGTYSVKLLTERYLKGKAGFTTSKEGGTTFFIILPKHLLRTPPQSQAPAA